MMQDFKCDHKKTTNVKSARCLSIYEFIIHILQLSRELPQLMTYRPLDQNLLHL